VDVTRIPLVIVVDPIRLTAPVVGSVSVAVQVLLTASATIGPGPTPRGWVGSTVPWVPGATDAELVTLPLGPVVPWVLTLRGPEGGDVWLWVGSLARFGYWPLKILAGPYWAVAPSSSVAVIGDTEPVPGSVTSGADPAPGALGSCPQPRYMNGPPKRLTLVK